MDLTEEFKLKRLLQGGLYLVSLAVVVFVLLEVSLAALYKVTKDEKFSLPALEEFDSDVAFHHRDAQRKNCGSLAIIGGSSAAGWNSEYGFGEIIDYELRQKDKCFFVKNFARPGASFVEFGAPLAMAILPYFDTVVVYSGHNEVWPKVYHAENLGAPLSGIDFKEEKLTWKKLLSREIAANQVDAKESLSAKFHETLFAISRTYHAFLKVSARLEDWIPQILESVGINKSSHREEGLIWPLPVESESTIDDVLRRRIDLDFKSSAERLLEKARSEEKRIIFSTVLSDLFWPPNFAVEGLESESKNAIQAFSLGRNQFESGNKQAALRLLATVSDLDGFPNRVLNSINEYIDTLPHAIDPNGKFHDFLIAGSPVELFMQDFQHPTALGHTLVAREVLCRLGIHEIDEISCGSDSIEDIKQANMRYNNLFFASEKKQAEMARSFLWHLKISEMSSALPSYFNKASKILQEIDVPEEERAGKRELAKFLASKPWDQALVTNQQQLGRIPLDADGSLSFLKNSTVVGRILNGLGFSKDVSSTTARARSRSIVLYPRGEDFEIRTFHTDN